MSRTIGYSVEFCKMNGDLEGSIADGGVIIPISTPIDYSVMTVVRLREELVRRRLSTRGRKHELITRLLSSDEAMQEQEVRDRRPAARNGNVASAEGEVKSHDLETTRNQGKLTQHGKMALLRERSSLVLWRRPLQTLYYFLLELLVQIRNYAVSLWRHRKVVSGLLLTFLVLLAAYHIDGSHQTFVKSFQKQFLWCAYWVGLGVLSSVGLGTGLHTFLLYLGPHIAAVTLAAFECMSVDFPQPPYPDQIICPEKEGSSMSLLTIMSKVRLEAFMWGAGTAIGELPPYFMARAARLSGQIEEEEQELEELVQERTNLSMFDRAKVAVHDLVQRVGFGGILLCASIPNPLFDLAGITCGHFLVPFWTFFGATLIGKAVIKMHIQKLFVIFVFSEHHVQQVVGLLSYIPVFGSSLQSPFMEYLNKQKKKLHHKPGVDIPGDSSWLSWVFEKLIMVMVVYFVLSIVNSMAQSYHKRLTERSSKANRE